MHVNRTKQHFTYDDRPQYNPTEILPKENEESLTESFENREMKFPDTFLENHVENLTEVNLLFELTKPLQLKKRQKEVKIKITTSTLPHSPLVCLTVENKVLLTWWKKKLLLAIMICLIVCLTVSIKVFPLRRK